MRESWEWATAIQSPGARIEHRAVRTPRQPATAARAQLLGVDC
jgi:hypothetical protein